MNQDKKKNNYKPGMHVWVRERDWVLLPSDDPDLLLLKPRVGTEQDNIGIYLPLDFEDDYPEITSFAKPGPGDLGDFSFAKYIADAYQFLPSSKWIPFRCLEKFKFLPGPQQIAPLHVALKQELPLRLLVADNTGADKKIETLMILQELLLRKVATHFAIIAPYPRCQMWQAELEKKLGLNFLFIVPRSYNYNDRWTSHDDNVARNHKNLLISMNYFSSVQRYFNFLKYGPDVIIVDESSAQLPYGFPECRQERIARLIRHCKASVGIGNFFNTC